MTAVVESARQAASATIINVLSTGRRAGEASTGHSPSSPLVCFLINVICVNQIKIVEIFNQNNFECVGLILMVYFQILGYLILPLLLHDFALKL